MLRTTALAAVLAIGVPPAAAPAGPAETTPSIQIRVERGGFHWLDAAVGSLAAIGLTSVIGGLRLVTRRSRNGLPPAKPNRHA